MSGFKVRVSLTRFVCLLWVHPHAIYFFPCTFDRNWKHNNIWVYLSIHITSWWTNNDARYISNLIISSSSCVIFIASRYVSLQNASFILTLCLFAWGWSTHKFVTCTFHRNRKHNRWVYLSTHDNNRLPNNDARYVQKLSYQACL